MRSQTSSNLWEIYEILLLASVSPIKDHKTEKSLTNLNSDAHCTFFFSRIKKEIITIIAKTPKKKKRLMQYFQAFPLYQFQKSAPNPAEFLKDAKLHSSFALFWFFTQIWILYHLISRNLSDAFKNGRRQNLWSTVLPDTRRFLRLSMYKNHF